MSIIAYMTDAELAEYQLQVNEEAEEEMALFAQRAKQWANYGRGVDVEGEEQFPSGLRAIGVGEGLKGYGTVEGEEL